MGQEEDERRIRILSNYSDMFLLVRPCGSGDENVLPGLNSPLKGLNNGDRSEREDDRP